MGPILCIHGTGGTALAWADAVDTLVRLGRVIAYDRRGCARSERPQPYERTHVGEHADDDAALPDALAAAPVIVVGRSYGAAPSRPTSRSATPTACERSPYSSPKRPRELAPTVAAWVDALADRHRQVAEREGIDAVAQALMREVAGKDTWRSFPDEIRQMLTGNGAATSSNSRANGGFRPTLTRSPPFSSPRCWSRRPTRPPQFPRADRSLRARTPQCPHRAGGAAGTSSTRRRRR
jgi:pimeloyl-ACP methyl ester carboxylesterase